MLTINTCRHGFNFFYLVNEKLLFPHVSMVVSEAVQVHGTPVYDARPTVTQMLLVIAGPSLVPALGNLPPGNQFAALA